MSKERSLIIGGTGKTGRKVVQLLQELKQDVRIGSRSANPAFDWQKPNTWEEALEGMHNVYITFQPDLAVPGALEAIEGLTKVAKTQGIQKLVLLSGKGEHEAELCEQVVINSGIDYTIVRASWFMQNFSESFFLDPILAGHVVLPKPEAKVPYVSTNDIAEVVVKALLHKEHNGNIYQLTGPELLTFKDVVSEISKVTGRDITFTPITLTAYTKMLEEFNVPSDAIWLINYLFVEVLGTEGNNLVTSDVEKILGRKPQSFKEYARQTASTGVWNTPVKHTV